MPARTVGDKLRSARRLDHRDLEHAVRAGEIPAEELQCALERAHSSSDISRRIEALLSLVPEHREPGAFETPTHSFASLAAGKSPDIDLTPQHNELWQLTVLALRSPSPDSRRAVARVVPHLPDAQQLLIVRMASASSDPWLRRWSIDRAVSLGAEGIDLIRDLVGDDDPCVAVPFLDLLLALHDRSAMHAAKRLLTHDLAEVRSRAALLVGLVGSRALASNLRRAAKAEEDPDVREALAQALAWLSGETPRPERVDDPQTMVPGIDDPSFGTDQAAVWRQDPGIRARREHRARKAGTAGRRSVLRVSCRWPAEWDMWVLLTA